MTKLGKLWTASIAYVALAVGAGLSIMYNVLQTVAVRGPALGWPDIVTAVAMPGIVVLMVELFVSRLWIGMPWYMQALRVLATASIGGVAMRASWAHGHDWMVGHGHDQDVAILWPLAIDLLAILATALLLAGRRGHGLATGQSDPGQAVASSADALATGQHFGQPLANGQDAPGQPTGDAFWPPAMARGIREATADRVDNPLAKILSDANWSDDLDNFDRRVDAAIGQTGQELASEAEQYLARMHPPAPRPAVPVVPGASSAWPETPAELLQAWMAGEGFVVYNGAAVDRLLAGWFACSTRTARRWRAETTGRPVSGPPSQEGEEK